MLTLNMLLASLTPASSFRTFSKRFQMNGAVGFEVPQLLINV